jgi:hypothetical protein
MTRTELAHRIGCSHNSRHSLTRQRKLLAAADRVGRRQAAAKREPPSQRPDDAVKLRSPGTTRRWYLLSMSQPTPERTEPSTKAERLRIAMGWDRLPETTPEEQAEFDAELARRDEEIRRYYGKPAA